MEIRCNGCDSKESSDDCLLRKMRLLFGAFCVSSARSEALKVAYDGKNRISSYALGLVTNGSY